MSTANAHASRQADPWGMYCTAMTSTMPRTNPPSMAPEMFPIPPRTAAVKALRPVTKPMR